MIVHELVGVAVHIEVLVGDDARKHHGRGAPRARDVFASSGEGDFIVGVAVAVGILIAESAPHGQPLFPGLGNIQTNALQPVLTDGHLVGRGNVDDGGDSVDLTVVGVGDASLVSADGSHVVGSQIQIRSDRHDRAFVDHAGLADALTSNQIRQLAGSDGGVHTLAETIFRSPFDVELHIAGFFQLGEHVTLFFFVGSPDLGEDVDLDGGFRAGGGEAEQAQHHRQHQDQRQGLFHGGVPPFVLS